jgi:GH25 family lysozyme M1 (1,4-beta-N-acetylmuramidase)
MGKPRHRLAAEIERVRKLRAATITVAALALSVLVSSGVWLASDSGPASGRLTAGLSASSASCSLPRASPAEGHSPRLQQELCGPLSGTGAAPSGSALAAGTLQQATAATATTFLNGIDVASFQHPNGAAIDWTQVATGYSFVAIKATEGDYYVNPYYATDAPAAVAAGMYVAAYHFAIPSGPDGATQAQYAVTNAGSYQVGGHYLPLMLDLEYDPYNNTDHLNECYGLTPSAMVTWISSFVAKAKALTGVNPIIYTPQAWWDTCTANNTQFRGFVLWVPAFASGSPGALPSGWNSWTMWQYSSSGTVPGISGPVDLDYFSGAPQPEQTVVNAPASVQIETLNALAGQPVTYSPTSATGLPPGTAINSTGLITGKPTATGTYQVTVTPTSAGVLPATVSFTWTVTSPPAPVVAVAALATNGVPYAQAPQLGTGWHSLGGTVTAVPAVAAAPNPDGPSPVTPWFIAPGTNHLLYIRGVAGGWQRLGPDNASCLSAAAVITNGVLQVACETTSHGLSYNTATIPATGLPKFTTAWRSLGGAGTITAGPAVTRVNGALTFFVLATDGQIHTRTITTGFTRTAWACLGQPAAATQAATGVTYFACQGTNHGLYESSNAGAGWSPMTQLSGTLAAGPGVAPTSADVVLLLEGTNHGVYEGTATAGYTRLGTLLVNGVEAAALN